MATIERRGPVQWRVKIRRKGPDGSPIRRSKTFDTYDEAKRWADTIEGRISGDEYVDKSKERRTTLRDILQRYLDEVTPEKKGAAQERYRIKQWMQEDFSALPIISIEASHIVEWRKRRRAEGKAPSTVNNAMNLLSAVFKHAIAEWSMKLENPVSGVKRIKPRKPREVYLTRGEEAALLEACRAGPPWLWWAARIALATAMRQGEIRKLRWEHIHEDEAYVRLVDTKNGEDRAVPLTEEGEAIFRKMRATLPHRSDGWVFGDPEKTKEEGGFTKDMVSQAFRDAAKRAGLTVTFHDQRHIATTNLAPLHRDALDLAKTTGHKTINVLAGYYNEKATDKAARMRQRAREIAEQAKREAARQARGRRRTRARVIAAPGNP